MFLKKLKLKQVIVFEDSDKIFSAKEFTEAVKIVQIVVSSWIFDQIVNMSMFFMKIRLKVVAVMLKFP